MTELLHAEPYCYGRAELCRAFGVSRSGLYDHVLKPQGSRRLDDKALAKRLKPIFRQSRRTYGARRLQRALRRQGVYCGRRRLVRLMGQLRLQPVQKRRWRPRTTQSVHCEPIAPNRLELRVSSSAKKKSEKNGRIGLFLEKDYRVLVSLLFPPNRGFGGSAPILIGSF